MILCLGREMKVSIWDPRDCEEGLSAQSPDAKKVCRSVLPHWSTGRDREGERLEGESGAWSRGVFFMSVCSKRRIPMVQPFQKGRPCGKVTVSARRWLSLRVWTLSHFLKPSVFSPFCETWGHGQTTGTTCVSDLGLFYTCLSCLFVCM